MYKLVQDIITVKQGCIWTYFSDFGVKKRKMYGIIEYCFNIFSPLCGLCWVSSNLKITNFEALNVIMCIYIHTHVHLVYSKLKLLRCCRKSYIIS